MIRTSIFYQHCSVKYLCIRKQIFDHLKLFIMNNAIISIVIVAGLLASCNNDIHEHANAEHGHLHGDETHAGVELESLAYTLYTDKTEIFVEFKPLIVGRTSKFASHFTQLGEKFKAITDGSVTVKAPRIGNCKPLPIFTTFELGGSC